MAKSKPKSVNKDYVIPKKEFYMFSAGALGQGMIYATMSSYISDYYTNVLFLPHIFILLLMLLARVWDAINDPLMGIIVDRHTTKWGKMKPYVVFAAVPIAILTFLMFWAPESMTDKKTLMIYCAVVYVLWGMIYTAGDVPFWSLPNVMTANPQERGQQISVGRTFNGIGSAIPMVLFVVLGWMIPGDDTAANKKKYLIMAIVASVIGIMLYINASLKVKERVVLPNKKKVTGQKSSLYRIFHCKPLMLVVIMGILSSGRYLMQVAAVHAARYAFEGASTTQVYTVLQICSAGGMFGAMLFMPALMKKFDYKKIVIVTCLAGFAASIITTLVGWFGSNFYICAPFVLLQCIPLGVLNVISYAMIGDSLDYMELQTGFRDNALGSACQGFVNKLGNALATAGVSLVYIIIGLDPSKIIGANASVSEAAILTTSQRFGMFSLISIIPGVCLLLCTIPIFFYDLNKKKTEKIAAELAEQRKAKGISVE